MGCGDRKGPMYPRHVVIRRLGAFIALFLYIFSVYVSFFFFYQQQQHTLYRGRIRGGGKNYRH